MSRQILVHSASMDLKEAMERVKLPRGVRWAIGGIAVVDGVGFGLLTRKPRRGEQRPTVQVKCERIDDVNMAVARGVQELG